MTKPITDAQLRKLVGKKVWYGDRDAILLAIDGEYGWIKIINETIPFTLRTNRLSKIK
jgi:hypothetical protein